MRSRARQRRAGVVVCALRALAVLVGLCASRIALAGDKPADWKDGEAYDLFVAAETARSGGLWDRCIESDTASLEKEDRTATHVHLAGCADKAGKILLGLRHLQTVLDAALKENDTEVAELAQQRVTQMLRRLGTLVIEVSADAKNVTVTVDDAEVSADRIGKPISVDPGKHRIHAEGEVEGVPATFDDTETVPDGLRALVVVALKPKPSEYLTPGQLACMQLAKTQAEVLACLPSSKQPLVVRAALEASTYGDTFSVLVFNPAVRASVASPASGWNIGASYLVDMITAASPDFVSTASPRGKDTRDAVAVNGGYKPGALGAELAAGYSTEADYVSRNASVAILGDLFDKHATPRLGYGYSNDTISRGGTPTDVFSHELETHEGTASVSVVLSPRTVLVTGLTAGFERGDPSKPYRLVPMFAAGVDVPKGAHPDQVNAERLSVRPYEQLPLARDRFAVGARLASRKGQATLRLEERLYRDSWGLLASTTDVRWLRDVGTWLTVGPHARFHAQTGASFYQRVYHAETTPDVKVPIFRTTDRELGPMWAVTGGASMWLKLSEEHASVSFSPYVSGDVLWSHYLNSLYVTERLAGYGTVGLEVQFE